jgi:hypothetical protein
VSEFVTMSVLMKKREQDARVSDGLAMAARLAREEAPLWALRKRARLARAQRRHEREAQEARNHAALLRRRRCHFIEG